MGSKYIKQCCHWTWLQTELHLVTKFGEVDWFGEEPATGAALWLCIIYSCVPYRLQLTEYNKGRDLGRDYKQTLSKLQIRARI